NLRERRAVFANESSEGAAETVAPQPAGEQRQMDVTTSLVPGSEGAGGDVVTHAFGRTAQKGELPVVNDAGAVGREVGEPAPFHHLVEQQLPAVLDEMRAVNQHDAGLAVQRPPDLLRAVVNRGHHRSRTGAWRCRGLDENFLETAFAP